MAKKHELNGKWLSMGIGSIALLSLAANVWLFLQWRKSPSTPAERTITVEEENMRLLERVRKLMVLPDELPTIAEVADPEKLKDQPFFAKAKLGDKVLVFTQAKKAVLYDPVADQIIEVAPINMGAPEAAPEKTP